MQVILTENVQALGQIGDVVNVAPGYARNFLFPKSLALVATGKNIGDLEHKKRILAQKREKMLKELASLADRLKDVTIILRRKVSEEEKLYGSVTVGDVSKGLEERGFVIERKAIHLEQPIKQLGEFSVVIRLSAQITAQVRVRVEKEE